MDRDSLPAQSPDRYSVYGKQNHHFLSGKAKLFLASSIVFFGAVIACAIPAQRPGVSENVRRKTEKADVSEETASQTVFAASSDIPGSVVLAKPNSPYANRGTVGQDFQAAPPQAVASQPEKQYGKYVPPPPWDAHPPDAGTSGRSTSRERSGTQSRNVAAEHAGSSGNPVPVPRIDENVFAKGLEELPPMEKWNVAFDQRPPLSETMRIIRVLKNEFPDDPRRMRLPQLPDSRKASGASWAVVRSGEWHDPAIYENHTGPTGTKMKATDFELPEEREFSGVAKESEIVSRKPPIPPDRAIYENPQTHRERDARKKTTPETDSSQNEPPSVFVRKSEFPSGE